MLRAFRLTGPAPVVDGRLDEAVWAEAEPAADFTQRVPDPGAPATQRSEVRVAYDRDAIYVGMRLYDTAPDSIAGQLGRRDLTGVFSDWVHVMIDSYHDRRTAFRFSLNPRGVHKDVLHFDDGNEDISWDAVWDASARVDSLGWTAEYRIPLSQLRFSAGSDKVRNGGTAEELVWGIDFGRDIARRNERTDWSPFPPDAPGFVSLFGDLRGLQDLRPPRQLEVLPYSVGRLTQAPGEPTDPFYERRDPSGKLGADFKYGLTSNLTLTGTINPDFGQVEADPSVLNLSTFETFFPEKRPFFIEGSSIFRFDIGFDDGSGEQLFYSRRVGRRPQGRPGSDAIYADIPDATTILAAGKLSGKTAGGWSVGVLEGLTSAEDARVQNASGFKRDDPVEPLSNYAVIRTIKDFRGGQSAIGAMLTSTNRKLEDGLEFLRSSAQTAGIDARHRFAGGNYQISGWTGGSFIQGSAAAIDRVQRSPVHNYQRPDAAYLDYDPLRTSLSGMGGHVWLSKIGGGHWRGGIGSHVRTPGFEVNDVGFQTSADEVLTFGNLRYEEYRPSKRFLRWSIGVNPSSAWNFGNDHLWSGMNLNTNADLTNFWGGYAGARRSFAGLSTDVLRGGPGLAYPAGTSWWGGFYSDSRKRIRLETDADGWFEDETDGWNFGLYPTILVRPSGRLDMSVGPSLRRNQVAWQYVAQPSAGGQVHYVFGELDQTTVALTLRLSYAFTRNLSLQVYGQPFVSAGTYASFKEVTALRAERFRERFHDYSAGEISYDAASQAYNVDTNGDAIPDFSFTNPDFNFKQFRSNVVVRWEYRPGSALFAVWGDERTAFDTDGSFAISRDSRRLLDADATDVFLVKLNYWLDL